MGSFLRQCRRRVHVVCELNNNVNNHVLFRRYRPLKLKLSCEVVEKKMAFGRAFSNRIHFRACGRFWLSFLQRAPRVADKNKRKKKIESR